MVKWSILHFLCGATTYSNFSGTFIHKDLVVEEVALIPLSVVPLSPFIQGHILLLS